MKNQHLNICLVDDDQIYQFTTKKTLELLNYDVKISSFTNGEQVLNFILQNVKDPDQLPDIILLDINMPVMDGWQFLQEFTLLKNALSKHIKIYMVSSSSNQADIKRSKENYGVEDFFVKPINRSHFNEILLPA